MLAAPPLAPDAPTARGLARRELGKQLYRDEQPGLLDRARQWVNELFADASATAGEYVPGGWGGVLVLLALLAVIVALIRRQTGGLIRTARTPGALFSGEILTASAHRDLAERAAAAGQWAEAVRERMRALARGLEERGLLDARPGRTADEVAADAAVALPTVEEDLRRSAHLFDEIWYGGRTATARDYDTVRATDDAAARTRPAAAGAPA